LFSVLGNRFLDAAAFGGFQFALAGAGRSRRRRRERPEQRPAAVTEPSAASVAVRIPEVVPLDPSSSGLVLRESIRFDSPPRRGVERLRVASRLVPLHAGLDPLSTVVERLDVGDEVDVLRQDGASCFVRTPTGREGWLPGHALTSGATLAPDGRPA
jgi:hypothetical protein